MAYRLLGARSILLTLERSNREEYQLALTASKPSRLLAAKSLSQGRWTRHITGGLIQLVIGPGAYQRDASHDSKGEQSGDDHPLRDCFATANAMH